MACVAIIGYDNVGAIYVDDSLIKIMADNYNADEIIFKIICAQDQECGKTVFGYEFGFFRKFADSEFLSEILTSFISKDAIPDIGWEKIPQYIFERFLMPVLTGIRSASKQN